MSGEFNGGPPVPCVIHRILSRTPVGEFFAAPGYVERLLNQQDLVRQLQTFVPLQGGIFLCDSELPASGQVGRQNDVVIEDHVPETQRRSGHHGPDSPASERNHPGSKPSQSASCPPRTHARFTSIANQKRRIFASEWLSATGFAGASAGASSFCSPYSLNQASPFAGSTLISA